MSAKSLIMQADVYMMSIVLFTYMFLSNIHFKSMV